MGRLQQLAPEPTVSANEKLLGPYVVQRSFAFRRSRVSCACAVRYEKRGASVWVFDGGKKKPYNRLVKHKGWI